MFCHPCCAATRYRRGSCACACAYALRSRVAHPSLRAPRTTRRALQVKHPYCRSTTSTTTTATVALPIAFFTVSAQQIWRWKNKMYTWYMFSFRPHCDRFLSHGGSTASSVGTYMVYIVTSRMVILPSGRDSHAVCDPQNPRQYVPINTSTTTTVVVVLYQVFTT